jgi:uncharacterized protein (DUF1810 family)
VTASDPYNLQRFVDAQQGIFDAALAELRGGAKQSHWMWFIFPQLAGLGRSATARLYEIVSLDEARAYIEHPLLGPRLRECVRVLLTWACRRSAGEILGPVDLMKLKSSLTLFDCVEPDSLFSDALLNFYGGKRDERTLALLDLQQ